MDVAKESNLICVVVVVVQNTFIHRVQTKLRLLLAYKFFLGVGTGIEY